MKVRWRILLVVTHAPPRGGRLAGSEPLGLPPRDAALMAARLLAAGADVKVLDQDAEGLRPGAVRGEALAWRADLVLLHAGGSFVADDPVPDDGPLRRALVGWRSRAPVVACGPLAARYGAELLERLPRLTGALLGDVHPTLVGAFRPGEVPGLLVRGASAPPPVPPGSRDGPGLLPAWHLLLLEALDARSPGGLRQLDVLGHPGDPGRTLDEVRHALHRGGARRLAFVDRDFGADPACAREVARGMFAAAPGVPWTCRVRADRLDPMLALALANGGCQEITVVEAGGRHAPGPMPMDDGARPCLEGAVEAARVLGLRAPVEHVVGRPGHSVEVLGAWQRWFRDRRMLVHPQVRVLHAGDRGEGQPRLEEARVRAGCWDNTLRPRDVERAVLEVSAPERLAAEAGGP